MRDLNWQAIGIVAACVLFAGWLVYDAFRFHDERVAHTAAFQTACAAERAPADCEAWAERYGDRCYELAYVPGGRYERARFRGRLFERCLHNSGRLAR